jgi:hypothetical protein
MSAELQVEMGIAKEMELLDTNYKVQQLTGFSKEPRCVTTAKQQSATQMLCSFAGALSLPCSSVILTEALCCRIPYCTLTALPNHCNLATIYITDSLAVALHWLVLTHLSNSLLHLPLVHHNTAQGLF